MWVYWDQFFGAPTDISGRNVESTCDNPPRKILYYRLKPIHFGHEAIVKYHLSLVAGLTPGKSLGTNTEDRHMH
jgi:hypothetical protein